MKQSDKARLLLTYVQCTRAFSVFAFNVHDQRGRMSAMGKSVAAESLAVFVAVRLTRFRSQTRGPSTTRFLLVYAYARRQQATYS